MGTRHLYWILPGPSFAVWRASEDRNIEARGRSSIQNN